MENNGFRWRKLNKKYENKTRLFYRWWIAPIKYECFLAGSKFLHLSLLWIIIHRGIPGNSGNPYAHFVEIAKLAQKDGVIKCIISHQDASNQNDNSWTLKVKSIFFRVS